MKCTCFYSSWCFPCDTAYRKDLFGQAAPHFWLENQSKSSPLRREDELLCSLCSSTFCTDLGPLSDVPVLLQVLKFCGVGGWGGLSSYISSPLPFLLLFCFIETWCQRELRLASGFVWGNLELLIPLLYLPSARIADVCQHTHFTSFMCLQGLNQGPIVCSPTTLLTELHPQPFFFDG